MNVALMYIHINVYVDILLLYIDGYSEPSEPKPSRKQTNPPSIPISQLYADKSFPSGLCMPYTVSDCCCHNNIMSPGKICCHCSLFFSTSQNDQVAAQRITSEEKRALERVQEDDYSDFRRAAEAHRYYPIPLTNGRG